MDRNKELRPSVLDRLIDHEPHITIELDKTRYQYLRELRQSVKRDLENLLNTRYRVVSPPEELAQLETSILNYGLSDLATINILDTDKKRDFTRTLEKTLRDYEPRLKSVKVSHLSNRDNLDRALRFRIDATLYADPAPEVVVFDSILDPLSRTVNLEEPQNG